MEHLLVEVADEHAVVPTRMTEGAAGYDMYSCETVLIPPRGRLLVSTGIRIAVPHGTYGRVAPRSGLACKGIDVGAGVIDSDYTGIVKVLLINSTEESFEVRSSDRVAQLIIEVIGTPLIKVVEKLEETKRGQGGFGSTGV